MSVTVIGPPGPGVGGAQTAGQGAGGAGGGPGGGQGNAGNKKKDDCKKKLSREDHKRLRRGSPSPEVREQVNSGPPPKICPACGLTTESFQADHIVPLKMIKQMPGFACLSNEDQMKTINNPLNYVGLCGRCNASKGSKLWHKWGGHSVLGLVQGVKENGKAITQALLVELKNQIKGCSWS